jgi:hypothetical protein
MPNHICPPLAAVPSIPNACGVLNIDALFPQGLLKPLSRMTQQPRNALVDLWLSTSLYWKLWWVAIRDGGSPDEDRAGLSILRVSADKHTRGSGVQGDVHSGPIYRLDAAGLATGEEAVHAHGAACGVLVRGLGEPVPWPREVAVGVVLQLDGGGLRVSFCFEEGAPGSRTLGEVGGEEGGERVREEGDDFRCVQYRLGRG